MIRNDYLYAICLFRPDGKPLVEQPVDVDWEPAVEWIRFLGVRQRKLSATGAPTRVVIEPKWHPTEGQPCVVALCVMIKQNDDQQVHGELPISYFAPLATNASMELVKKGVLQVGELFRYLVVAYPVRPGGQADAHPAVFSIQELNPSLPLKQSSLADFARRSVQYGQNSIHTDIPEIPVFLPQEILEETADLSRKAGALETGGILIGHVHQDPSLPEIFVEVTAQIPARYSRCELMQLTFTPDTWSAVSTSIQLRKKNEIMLGWWHSHSYLKQLEKNDDSNRPTVLPHHNNATFLSDEDLALHRTCFPRAYSLALLVAEGQCSGLTWALFGWNTGIICPRHFQVLPRPAGLACQPITTKTGENGHD